MRNSKIGQGPRRELMGNRMGSLLADSSWKVLVWSERREWWRGWDGKQSRREIQTIHHAK